MIARVRGRRSFALRGAAQITMALACLLGAPLAHGQPAPDGNSVLILDSTVSGGAGSLEATKAAGLGYTVVVDDAAAWGARSTADFATFRSIILGDATCSGIGTAAVAAAEANRGVWSPAVTGNVVVIGTDPVFHQGQGGDQVTESGIAFAADAATTGAYITLSCYYHDTPFGTPVPLLDQFGSFTARGVGCFNDAHIVAVHPALAGMTDASLSNWFCSIHEAFDSFPGNFLPLAIGEGVGDPGSLTFADGSEGVPYVLARGEEVTPIFCGDGILQSPPEECDDGNNANGDGCSSICKLEICGNGVLDAGEECDDGNTAAGDGCSPTCTIEPVCTDNDNDLVTTCDGDCDDNDHFNTPGRDEICDGQDNNCDGIIDEGFDADGDGSTTCGGDCDDGDAANFPGNAEVCDGGDNNCDGVIDEGFDVDADGYTSCGGDCNDDDAAVNPGAEEVCDLQDNDCDGLVDEGPGDDVTDTDADGVTDTCDNCKCVANADQADADEDGAGTACDVLDDVPVGQCAQGPNLLVPQDQVICLPLVEQVCI